VFIVVTRAQGMFKRLQEEGFILEDTIEQLYSEALGKFLADRFVVGTCPKCSFDVSGPFLAALNFAKLGYIADSYGLAFADQCTIA